MACGRSVHGPMKNGPKNTNNQSSLKYPKNGHKRDNRSWYPITRREITITKIRYSHHHYPEDILIKHASAIASFKGKYNVSNYEYHEEIGDHQYCCWWFQKITLQQKRWWKLWKVLKSIDRKFWSIDIWFTEFSILRIFDWPKSLIHRIFDIPNYQNLTLFLKPFLIFLSFCCNALDDVPSWTWSNDRFWWN